MILATTAVKDYWGDSKELLLAGEWCKLGNDRYLVNRNYKIVGYPWNDRKRLYSAYVYTKLKYKIPLQNNGQNNIENIGLVCPQCFSFQ